MEFEIKKIYKEKGKSYVDLRHYKVLECIRLHDVAVIKTPKGTMELTPRELSEPIILSEKTIESKFGGRYVLFSYPLKVKSEGLSEKEMATLGVFG